jgi:hypothetical protein
MLDDAEEPDARAAPPTFRLRRLRAPLALLGAATLLSLAAVSGSASDDLTPLSDELESAAGLTAFSRVSVVEGWGVDQLEVLDAGALAPGYLRMVPYTSSWYEDYRGVLLFKEVSGDFVVTTRVRTSGRTSAVPQSEYSLAGIMIREPRSITPGTWSPGGENYVFLSHGSASPAGNRHFEVKTTIGSVSVLDITDVAAAEVRLRGVRLGEHVILLRQIPGEEWTVHRRYTRADFSPTLQVGLTVYTDWPVVSGLDPLEHNGTVIDAAYCGVEMLLCEPDLVADFAYLRFQRPVVPPSLVGADFSNEAAVSDEELLSFLGAQADGVPIFGDGFESGDLSAWDGP